MYKNFNLTESEREQILKQHQEKGYKKPLNEQGSTKLKLKRGDILTVVKKNDTSKSPVEILAGVSASYDSGMGQRIEVRVMGGDRVQIDLDSVKMEFGDYKITKVNGQPVGGSVTTVKPVQKPIKPGSKGPSQFINIVNILTNKVIMKLQPNYNLRWSEGTEGGTPQLVGKTDKGETVVMDFECGKSEGNIVFTVIRHNNGKMFRGDFMSLGQNINAGKICGEG